MTNERKIYFTDKDPESDYYDSYISELEEKLWRTELEIRKERMRAEELQNKLVRQKAYRKAAKRRAMRIINCAATILSVGISYLWVLAAAAGDLPALSAAIPITVGLAAAYRWGRY